MPTIKRTTVLAANASASPLQGSQYEYLPFAARVEFAIVTDTGGVVEANASSGTDILLENSPVDELAATEPIRYPDHYTVDDVAAAGERLGLVIRETGGAGATVRSIVRITPI